MCVRVKIKLFLPKHICYLLLGSNVAIGGTCTTPRNDDGVCINIRECPLHLDYLMNKRNEPGIIKYLQDAVCRKQGSNVYTCCPEVKSSSHCQTPSKKSGECISIKACPELLSMLGRYKEPGVAEFLKASHCGTKRGDPFVCCPIAVSNNPSPPSQPAGTWSHTEEGDVCETPRKAAGKCINIKKCPELLSMLDRFKEQGVTQYLRESQCGLHGGNPLVCCPNMPSGNTLPSGQPGIDAGGSGNLPAPNVCGISKIFSNKVVNGKPASLGAWPWMVALGYSSPTVKLAWKCGGTLISDRYVVTAAHCAVNFRKMKLTTARVGDLDLNDDIADKATPIDIPVEKAITHEYYNSTAHTVDIALVKLQNRVQFTDLIRPICLPTKHLFDDDLTGYSPFIAGWGATFYKGPSRSDLQEAQLDITDNESCAEAYANIKGATIDSRVICAQSPLGKDACQGDSGGPLMLPKFSGTIFNFYLVGVVSYGYKCAEPGYPGIYTRVDMYTDWIKKNIS